MIVIRPCDCGSGFDAIPLHDGYHIFMCYTCAKCYNKKIARFRPDIFERYETDEPIDEE
jgi:hypothetical protein